jgi:GntR family transcriptional regulator, transcriptional repressor for pyruvate dehydrogenase complex
MPATSAPLLHPVRRRSLSDAVFEQLRDQILRGERAPGSSLPAERVLCEALGVNRGAVREALRRLEQARLVAVRQGGSSRVLDYRASAGLELLAALLVSPEGRFDAGVVRSILEMRSALGPDVARLAASRGGAACADRLGASLAEMGRARRDLARLQDLVTRFWAHLVDGADNVAYRLAFNALSETYDRCRALLARPLEAELGERAAYAAIAEAVRIGDAQAAEVHARVLLRRGEAGVLDALGRLQALEGRA